MTWSRVLFLLWTTTSIHAVPLAVVVDDADRLSTVRPVDTELQPPKPKAGRIIAPITAYHWRGYEYFPDRRYELPMYSSVNRQDTDFWNYLLDELLLSRVPVVMFHGRGCWKASGDSESGQGDMCPRVLSRWLEATERLESTGIKSYLKVAMFIDTAVFHKYTETERFDLSKKKNWKWFWNRNIRVFFDEIPRRAWYLHQGRPVVAWWNLRDAFFVNQADNGKRMLEYISKKFQGRYGVKPFLLLQYDWMDSDPSLRGASIVDGVHNWFTPVHDIASSIYTYTEYNGENWGVTCPSFRSGGYDPGCGGECREVSRRDGETLSAALSEGTDSTGITMLEGWTDMAESAGFYRSNDWDYPSQYINIVRRYADPEPATLVLQAEGADEFFDTTPENLGGHYADRGLDVGQLAGEAGWYVGWVEKGEWLQFNDIHLGCGHYRITARIATRNDEKKISIMIGDTRMDSVKLPFTGGITEFRLVHLGQVELPGGTHNIRVTFETDASLNVDYIFIRRTSECKCTGALKALQECFAENNDIGTACDKCASPIIGDTSKGRKQYEAAVCPAIKSVCPCKQCREHLEEYVKCYSKVVLGRDFDCCNLSGETCKNSKECCGDLRCIKRKKENVCLPCRKVRKACSANGDCCTGMCGHRRCCVPLGQSCKGNGDCCGGRCRQGKCSR